MSSSAFSGARAQKRRILLLLTLFLAALGALTSHVPIASAAVKSFEVEAYEQALDIPSAVARDDLEVQARGGEADIVGDLEDSLQEDFAGVWFDPESGEYVILIVSSTVADAVGKEMAAARLTNDYRTVVVQHSWRDLEAAQQQIDSMLSEFLNGGLIYTSIDPRTNAVVVHVSSIAGEKDLVILIQTTEGFGNQVELRAANDDRFQGARDACSNIVPNCGRPFRGGVEIGPWKGPNAGICTAGFLATGDADGQRYVLTAGHCAAEKNPSNPIIHWQALDEQKLPFYGEPNYLGAVNQLAFPTHDWMKINASGTWWDQVRPWPTMVAYWKELSPPNLISAEYPIYGEASSVMGQGVCHSGIASGGSCGQVTETNVSFNFGEPGSTTHDLIKVKGACSDGGDSGGPWFATNIAYGIHIGKDTAFNICGSSTFYQEVTDATDALGVTITPGISEPSPVPPTVQTDSASAIQEKQATLNGTVNPNSQQTSYRLEYGTSTSYGTSAPVPDGNAGAGSSPGAQSAVITNLQPNTHYHYRLVATNATGTTYGTDHAFTTGVKWLIRNSNSAGVPEASFWYGLPGEVRVVGDWDGNGTETPGSYAPLTGEWKLRNSNSTGTAEIKFSYGGSQFVPVVGDWDGNGTTTVGLYEASTGSWLLRNSNSPGGANLDFDYGGSQFKPVVGDWDGNGTTTIGLYEPSAGTWALRNTNNGGNPEISFQYGGSQFTPVFGDWDGNGTTTIGLYEPNAGAWALRNTNGPGGPDISFQYGGSQFTPVVGNWDGKGGTSVGLSDPNAPVERNWLPRNSNSEGGPDLNFWYGWPGEVALVGDWDGNGTETPGLYVPSTGTWKLRNGNSSGSPEISFSYGGSQFKPIVGDWNGNGTTTIGLYEPNAGTWELRNSNSGGNPDLSFQYGGSQFKPVVGDWDGNGTTTIGLYEPNQGRWQLRNSNKSGNPNLDFSYGGSQFKPIVGDWNGNGTTTIGLYEPNAGTWALRNSNSGGNPDISFQYGGSQYDPVAGDWNGDGLVTAGLVTK